MHDPANSGLMHIGLLDDPASAERHRATSQQDFQAALALLLQQAPPFNFAELAHHFRDDGYYGSEIRRLLLELDEK